MPTLVTIGNIKVRMFADDHNPPHFHVLTPDHEALVRISDFAVLRGSIDRRSYEIAVKWAGENRERLEHEWQRLNAR
jgi:hypothetical protein